LTSVVQGQAGELWAASRDGIWRLSGGRYSRPKWLEQENQPQVYALARSSDGSFWAAGEQFLMCFDEVGIKWECRNPPIKGEAVRAICAVGTNLWLGTYYSTLLKVEGTNVSVVAPNASFGGSITSLACEGPETLWIGTSDGLYRWERGQTKSWATKDGLLAASIQALHRDPDGTLWIGTLGGGLARLKEGRIVSLTTRQGLVDDVILQIVADDVGHLWLGCNRGVMRLERSELDDFAEGRAAFVHPILLDEDDGMVEAQCAGGHSPTAMKTPEGRLLFPTLGGLVEIDPRQLKPGNGAKPQAVIEEFLVDGQPQRLDATVVIPPGVHQLEVNYGAPSLHGGEWVRFRTRLEGLDADWVAAGNRRSVSYGKLRPGRYVFRVVACNSAGVWNEDGAALPILVKPYFWQSVWFGTMVAGLIGVGVFFVYRNRAAHLEAERAARETFTRQLIGAQEAERARLARELHDDITQRLARLAIDAGQIERGAAAPQIGSPMREVREELVRLSEDVHSLSYRLHSSLLEDLGLAEAVKAECERFSRQESIHMEVKVRDLPPVLPKEVSLGLFRIAQEALRNVTRHARAHTVDVTLRALDGGLQLAVRDDGVGFDPSHKRERISLGLASMRERAGLLGGELDIESAFGHGTTVIAWVPLNDKQP
jgi:signal transduction histidine kinase